MGMKGERMILFAEIYGNRTVTSCPFRANDPKAENLLKTKGRKRRFSFAKAENILKKSQLSKTMEMQNVGDKLFGHVAAVSDRRRSEIDATFRRREAAQSPGAPLVI